MKNSRVALCRTSAVFLALAAMTPPVAAQEIIVRDDAPVVIIQDVELIPEPVNNKSGRISTRLKNAEKKLSQDVDDVSKSYNDFKSMLSNDYGLSYSLDVSVTGQKGVPNGGKTAVQTIYAPTVSWEMFNDKTFGSGTIDVSYTAVRYGGNNAENIGNKLYLANSINDFTTYSNSFDQLSYTQTLFDNQLAILIGQFPIYDFDGTQYDSNQQSNFINYALSQNASETYGIAGLGSYVQYNPTSEISITAGFQNAQNPSGNVITTKDFGKKRFTSFGSVSWSPTVKGMGTGQYSLLVYNQPSVEAQPENTTGWSVNMSQNLNEKWGVFMRANAATGSSMPIKQSYVLGGVYNNPLNRNPLDQIGFAVAYNKVNQKYFDSSEKMRNFETVLETYWAFGITQFFTITPDVQLFVHPASKEDRKFGTVFSLRGTVMF